ncbi:unnamed protein product [Cylicostephanus goldi]|uniref:Uncharacterized protein n=1 Tax=Cylicostephanus goldi TaxID=71465 RepID=A0A3P6TAL8_CYLGO|nr:unnamed protein product [Cylicostephanus goldi]
MCQGCLILGPLTSTEQILSARLFVYEYVHIWPCESLLHHCLNVQDTCSFKGSLSRSWDLALCHESFAILLYDEERKELIFTQRFRPAALIGLARHRAPPKTKLESIDWSSQPSEWAYTLELCSGHYDRNASKEQIMKQVKECVAHRCGYLINEMDFVTSYLIGISFSGDRQRVYYAKVNSSMKVKDWKPMEDVSPVSNNFFYDT